MVGRGRLTTTAEPKSVGAVEIHLDRRDLTRMRLKITVTRSGGIAGAIVTATIDTAELAPDQARTIETIVAHTISSSDGPATMPDAFQYDVTIDDGSDPRTLCFHGDPCPASDLFAAIRRLA